MKIFFLALCLAAIPPSAHAARCSKTPVGKPCTPDPGSETDTATREIYKSIKLAQELEPILGNLRAKYRAVRDDPNASAEEKFAACSPYYSVKMAQDLHYQDAIDKAAQLYGVRPDNTGPITIGPPNETAMSYMHGLTATWKPVPVDSGPGVVLAIKVVGSDGQPHYSGATSMDPKAPEGLQGYTVEDGRVLILKGMIDIALERKNIGILARVIYHESRHFNRLTGGWSGPGKEEELAYGDDVAAAKVFELEDEDIETLKAYQRAYANAVKNNELTSRLPPADQQKLWKDYYEQRQINLDDEYSTLLNATEAARRAQLEKQRREKIDREARGTAEKPRMATRAELDALAARCGYQFINRNRENDDILGFKDRDDQHYYSPQYATALNLGDLKIALLIRRACQEVDRHPFQKSPGACNEAASILRERALSPGFAEKLNYLFGQASRRGACVNNVIDNAHRIMGSASFEKVIADYHVRFNKRLENEYKQSQRERAEQDRRRNDNPAPPTRNNDRDCFRSGDPFGCQPR